MILPFRKLGTDFYDLNGDLAEKNDVAVQYPGHVERLTKKATDIVLNGRTTPGAAQANDTGYWDSLKWISEAKYDARQSRGQ